MKVNENDMIIKITLYAKSIPEVVYYNIIPFNTFIHFRWYFEYLQALLKVAHPKEKVSLYFCRYSDSDILLGDDFIEARRLSLLRKKKAMLTQNSKEIQDDLFGFASSDNEAKITQIKNDIDSLENGTYPIWSPETYKNIVKKRL